MFWVQIAVSFLLWLCFGGFMARNSARLRVHSFGLAPKARAVRCAALLAASPFGIFVPLWIVWSAGGAKPDALEPWAWALVTLGGLACVATATIGLAYAVSLAMESARRPPVTTVDRPASSKEDLSKT